MTIKNNSLSDKLNEFKNNKIQKPLEDELTKVPTDNPLVDFLNSFIILATLFLKSIIFGFSLNIILKTDWNFLAILCIGLSISFISTYILQLIQAIRYKK